MPPTRPLPAGSAAPAVRCLVLLGVCLLLAAPAAATAAPPHVSEPASADNGTCGICTIPECPFETYKWDNLTWFEHNCREFTSQKTQTCIGYTASISHYREPHEHEHAVPYVIITIFASFALGAIIRHLFKDTAVPYTVILFLVGIAWGYLSKVEAFNLAGSVVISGINPHLIFHIFLPVLIFESAFAMEIPVFKKVIWQCLMLAGPGLIICSVLTAAVAKYLFTDYDWNWYACLLFGTILSATDPVAVVALLKDLGASPIISTMIEGESLFNDGTAIVFFTLLVEAIQVKSCDTVDWASCGDQCICDPLKEATCTLDKEWWEMILILLKVALGGPVVGAIVGAITVQCLNRVFNDALIEITLTFVAAYVTFFCCEVYFVVSGVLGVVACGCILSYYRHCISPEVMHTLHEFWEITVYLTNTLIFTLAGMITSLKAFDGVTGKDIGYLIITYIAINVIRFSALALFSPILRNCFTYKLDLGSGVLVAWGGLRGAVGLALALIVQADENVAFESVRTKFVFITAGIVILTLCVNGVTTQFVVKMFKLDEIEERKKKRIHDVWNSLIAEQTEDFLDLGSQPLLYDTNWRVVGEYADMRLAIPREMEDPYNRKGWFEKRNLNSSATEVETKERVEGKAAYLTTISASLMKQYKLGSLRRTGIRNMSNDISTSKDMEVGMEDDDWTKTLIQPDWVKKYFEETAFDRYVEAALSFVPGMHERLLRERWQNGFDIALGYIASHAVCRTRIHALSERHVANQIDTHCKRTNIGIVQILSESANHRPDISCSLKTRTACRNILNAMYQDVAKMKGEARLDAGDAQVLKSMIVNVEKRVSKKFPGTLDHANARDVLGSLPWFQGASLKTRQHLNTAVRDEARVVDVESGKPLSEVPEMQNDVGVVVVIVGIIQLRVGRKIFAYGAGYTAYLNRFLTGHERFSDIWTESFVRLLVIPESVLMRYIEDEMFFTSIWRACGVNTTRCLMGIDDGYDPKIWDDRKIRKTAERGHIVTLQDPKLYEASAERRHKLDEGNYRCLLRGRAWEYGEERDHIGGSLCRFPCLIPGDFKFATFTGHAVLFEMEAETSASQRAKVKWGRLKSKIKSINIWSNLRGPEHGRACLALAFGRTPLVYHPDQSMSKSSKQQAFQLLDEDLGSSQVISREEVNSHPSNPAAVQDGVRPQGAARGFVAEGTAGRGEDMATPYANLLGESESSDTTPPPHDEAPPPSASLVPASAQPSSQGRPPQGGHPYYQQYSYPMPQSHVSSPSTQLGGTCPITMASAGGSPLYAGSGVSVGQGYPPMPGGRGGGVLGGGGLSPMQQRYPPQQQAATLQPLTPASVHSGLLGSILPPSSPRSPMETTRAAYAPEYPAVPMLGGGVVGSPLGPRGSAQRSGASQPGSPGVELAPGFVLPPPPDFHKILEDVHEKDSQTLQKHTSFKKLLEAQSQQGAGRGQPGSSNGSTARKQGSSSSVPLA